MSPNSDPTGGLTSDSCPIELREHRHGAAANATSVMLLSEACCPAAASQLRSVCRVGFPRARLKPERLACALGYRPSHLEVIEGTVAGRLTDAQRKLA